MPDALRKLLTKRSATLLVAGSLAALIFGFGVWRLTRGEGSAGLWPAALWERWVQRAPAPEPAPQETAAAPAAS